MLTPLVQQQIEARAEAQGIPVEQAREDLLREKQPMLDFTTPEKIGALAVFLCGEAAVDDHRRRPVDRRRLDGAVAIAPGVIQFTDNAPLTGKGAGCWPTWLRRGSDAHGQSVQPGVAGRRV